MTMRSAMAILAAVALLTMACEECDPSDTRCRGDIADICSSNGQWELMMDCAEVEGGGTPWTCCYDPETGDDNCMPAEACDGGEL